MIDYIRRHLGIKLLLSYLVVILSGVPIIAIANRFTVPEAFNRHMGLRAGLGMMPLLGRGNGMMVDLYQSFQASFNEALVLSLLAAGVIAAGLSVLLSRMIIAPVRQLTTASQRIASGHYGERVPSPGSDELGQLAQSFNHMAEKLEQIEMMRRQLIGDVSHELRTPLTSIKGSMEGLIDGVIPAVPETFQQLHQEAGRLERLVDDLQELSRIEAGAYSLDLRPLFIEGVVKSVVKRFQGQIKAKHIELQTRLDPNLPAALADPDRLIQILTNLIGNALQYTPERGRIRLTAVPQGNEIQIAVQDDGIGIPPEHLQQIFTRFYRVDKSRSRQTGGGSGIGLTVVKYLVEAQGGRVWAESEGAGKGSTFTFTLKTAS